MMRNTYLRTQFLLMVAMLFTYLQPALAENTCGPYVPPKPERIDTILDKADQIVWVRVKSVEPSAQKKWVGENVTYHLDVIQEFKGNIGASSFALPGVRRRTAFAVDPMLLDATFRHDRGLSKADTADVNEAMVWRQKYPVVGQRLQCEYAPYFDVGLEYIIVLTKPYSLISFEPVLSPWDPWLDRVDRRTRAARAAQGKP